MSSETSTRPGSSFHAWHWYLLLGMAAATVVVWRAIDTQPASLLLLSGAVLAAALVAMAVHYTLLAFWGEVGLDTGPLDARTRSALEQEKAVVLRSIKELEFDRAMGKIGDTDYEEINERLRARALSVLEQLERENARAGEERLAPPPTGEAHPAPRAAVCPSCGAENDADARFCKACGTRVAE